MSNMSNRDVKMIKKLISEAVVMEELVEGYDLGRFLDDEKTQRAACMTLINIGELVKHLSKGCKSHYTHVPWRAYSELRNVTAHEYQALRMEDVWVTIESDLPVFKKNLQRMLGSR